MRGEVVAQPLHLLVIGTAEVAVGYLVEADEVDAAFKSAEQPYGLAGMVLAVIESAEDRAQRA